jgi:membrane protease YdiL (CAAX protease family)
MKNIQTNRWAMGVIWVFVGIILDVCVQIGSKQAAEIAANNLHTKVDNLLPISISALTVIGLLAFSVYVLLKAIHLVNPKVGLHKFELNRVGWSFKGYGLILLAGILTNVLQQTVNGRLEVANNQAKLISVMHGNLEMVVFIVLLTLFVGPILEELIFRGIVMNYFFTKRGWWVNVIFSGALFGYFHVMLQNFQLFAFIQYSLMGMVLAFVYKKTKQLQYSMLTHFINNAIATLILLITIFK